MAADSRNPQERAKRLARLIVNDIILYNQEKIVEGIRDDTLFEVLSEELDVARKYYDRNVDPSVSAQADYFNLAVVDILVKGRGNVQSKIW
jgi:hypothetical protein